MRGYVRLATDTENVRLSSAERVKALGEILPMARAEEKWAVLAGLAKLADVDALGLALSMLDDPATRAEAAQAVTRSLRARVPSAANTPDGPRKSSRGRPPACPATGGARGPPGDRP